MIDVKELYSRLGDEPEIVEELVVMFLEDTVSMLTALKLAVEQSDTKQIWHGAHSIKGAAANLSITHVCDEATKLEHMAREGVLDGSRAVFTALRTHVEQLRAEVAIPGWLDRLTLRANG